MRKIRNTWITLLILLVLTSQDVCATTVQEHGAWLVGLYSGAFGPDDEPGYWRYALQGQARSFSLGDGVRQGVIRGGLGYQLNSKVTLWGGYAYYHTDVDNVGTAYENRTWQQLNWTMGRGDWGTFKSRTRMEQRFRENRDGTGWWIRQQFRADVPVHGSDNLSVILGVEAFFHLNDTSWSDSGFIQNRVIIGLGYKASPGTRIELGYMNQFYRVRESEDLMNHLAIVNFRFQ